MGTACCIKPPSKPHFQQLEPEEIYVNGGVEMPYPETERPIHTRRTSEPSLLPLNNQITNMINTFEKCHGTISNSFTRTTAMLNSLSLAPKIKYHEQQVSEIMFKKNRLSDKKHIKNSTNEKDKTECLPSIKENRESEIQKQGDGKSNKENREPRESENTSSKHQPLLQRVSQRESSKEYNEIRSSGHDHNQVNMIPKIKFQVESAKNLEFDLSGSCSWEEENQENSENEDMEEEDESNFLDESLVNQQVCQQRRQLIKEYNKIHNNTFREWLPYNFQKCSLDIDELFSHQFSPVFSASLSAIAVYYDKFNISLCAFTKNQGESLVKLHINGQKRWMPVDDCSSPFQLFNLSLEKLYSQNQIPTTPCNQVYHLSGWVPEVLFLGEIQNKDNLWDRLIENFNDGNIVITFGCGMEVQSYLTLWSIDTDIATLKLICTSYQGEQNKLQVKQIQWEELLTMVESIYINWNPSIYNFVKKIDSRWVSRLVPFQNQAICLQNNPQYLIKIPKHSQDFEIRVFADRYVRQFSQQNRLSLKLFEYNGSRIMSPHESVRSLQVDSRQLISDVFIFQKSETVDYFVLVVLADDDEVIDNHQVAFTLLFLSFVDIEVKELPKREILRHDSTLSKVTRDNVGFGLNSPDFFKNVQYSLRVSPESWLQIQVQSTEECEFSLILVEDKNCQMDLARIDFETILNESAMSQTFLQYGFIEKQVTSQYYILVVALTKPSESNCKFKITAHTSSKLFKRNKQLQGCYSAIEINQIFFTPNIIKEVDIRWHYTNPGPRKRLKHTSTQVVYHPASIFEEFLKNPHIILKLEKGNYQFNLVCDHYREMFYRSQHSEGEPPALSIAVLKNSDNNKGYKIVVDDAFYVPIGYGFWTSALTLEQGRYTIVCARVEKSDSRGKLRVRKL